MKVSTTTLLVLLVLALLFTVGGIIIILEKLGASPSLTGFATFDTGVVNVTIQATVDINLIVDNVDFGTGTVTLGGLNTSLNTSDAATIYGGGTNPNGFSNPGPFQLENDGNVDVNITANSTNTATTFIGGTNPGYYFIGSLVGTDDGCLINITNTSNGAATFLSFSTTPQLICDNLTYSDAADTMNISIFLDIPSDAATGLHTDSGFQVHAEQVVTNQI